MENNINFKEDKLETVQQGDYFSRRIRCKKSSISKLRERFKQYRISRLEKKLAAEVKKLAGSQFTEREVNKGMFENKSYADRVIDRRTKAVIKLSEKLRFLNIGEYPKALNENFHAIKIQKIMYNGIKNQAYGLHVLSEMEKRNLAATVFGYANGLSEEEIDKNIAAREEKNKTKEDKQLTKEDIKNAINEKIGNNTETKKDSREQISKSYDEQLEKLQATLLGIQNSIQEINNKMLEEKANEKVAKANELNAENVKKSVDESFENAKTNVEINETQNDVTFDDVKEIVEENVATDEYTEEFNGNINDALPIAGIKQIENRVFPPVALAKIKNFENIAENNNTKEANNTDEVNSTNDEIFGTSTVIKKEDKNDVNTVVVEDTNRDVPIVVADRDDVKTVLNDAKKLSGLYDEFGNTSIANLAKQEDLRNEIHATEDKLINDAIDIFANKETTTIVDANTVEENTNEISNQVIENNSIENNTALVVEENENANSDDDNKVSNEENVEVVENVNEEEFVGGHQISIDESMKQQEEIGFDLSNATEQDVENVVNSTSNVSTLEAAKARIKALLIEKARTKEIVQAAKDKNEASKEAELEMIKMLNAYGNELESECNNNLEEMNKYNAEADERTNMINAIKSEIGLDNKEKKK